jgi:hypothetical protein
MRIIWVPWWWRWYAETCRSFFLDITIKWSFWCICWSSIRIHTVRKFFPLYTPPSSSLNFFFSFYLVIYSYNPKLFTVKDVNVNEMYRIFVVLRYSHPIINSDPKWRATTSETKTVLTNWRIICLSVCQSIYLYLSKLSTYPSIHPSIHLFHPSIHPSIYCSFSDGQQHTLTNEGISQ